MTYADQQGAAWNMVGVSDVVQRTAVEALPAPMGTGESSTTTGWWSR